jgi:hypothetical protein
MLRRILVGDNERVLLIRKKRLADILAPGEYWIFTVGRNVELERANVKHIEYAGDWSAFIVNQRPELAARFFTVVQTSASEVAVVSLDGKVARVIGPSTRVLFWRGAVQVASEIIDVRLEPEVPEHLVPAMIRLGREALAVFASVDEGKRGLVYMDGRMVRQVGPGVYGYWSVLTTPRIEVLETRRQAVEVAGQEILTKDKVTIRVNVSAVFEIVNAATARAGVKDVNEYLYRALQIAVRQTLGKRTLEEVLAEKTDLDEAVAAEVRSEMELYGVRVGAIALKDIILPGCLRAG